MDASGGAHLGAVCVCGMCEQQACDKSNKAVMCRQRNNASQSAKQCAAAVQSNVACPLIKCTCTGVM